MSKISVKDIQDRFMGSAGQVDGNNLAALFRADVGYLLSKLEAAKTQGAPINKVCCKTGFHYEDGECQIHDKPANPAVWLDISTAPRNGEWILVKQEGVLEPSVTVCAFDADWGSDGWWLCSDGKLENPLRGPEPTLWMPLPVATVSPAPALTAVRNALEALFADMKQRIDAGCTMGEFNTSGGYKDGDVYVFPWGTGVQLQLENALAIASAGNHAPALETDVFNAITRCTNAAPPASTLNRLTVSQRAAITRAVLPVVGATTASSDTTALMPGAFTHQPPPSITVDKIRDSLREHSGGHSCTNLARERLWFPDRPVNMTQLAADLTAPAPAEGDQ